MTNRFIKKRWDKEDPLADYGDKIKKIIEDEREIVGKEIKLIKKELYKIGIELTPKLQEIFVKHMRRYCKKTLEPYVNKI